MQYNFINTRMNTFLLLQPVYKNDSFAYVSSLGRYELFQFKNVHRDLYVFCKHGCEKIFKTLITTKLEGTSKSGMMIRAPIDVFKVTEMIDVVTTASCINFFDDNFKSDVVHKTTLFIMRALCDRSYEALKSQMFQVRESSDYLFIYHPESMEMRFLLAKLFQPESTELDCLTTDGLAITHITPVYKLRKNMNLSNIYTPTGYYKVSHSGDVIDKFAILENSSTLDFLKRYPIVALDVVKTLEAANTNFSPVDKIKQLTLSVYLSSKIHFFHLIIKSPYVEYDFGEYSPNHPRTIECFETEVELLQFFFEHYASGMTQ